MVAAGGDAVPRRAVVALGLRRRRQPPRRGRPRTPPSPTRPTRARRCSWRWSAPTSTRPATGRACSAAATSSVPATRRSRPRSRWRTSTSAARCRSAATRCSTGSRVEDAADAIVHALEHAAHRAVHNLTHPEVPPTNAALFDAISAAQGLPAAGLPRRDRRADPADLGRPADGDRLHREPVVRPVVRRARLGRAALTTKSDFAEDDWARRRPGAVRRRDRPSRSPRWRPDRGRQGVDDVDRGRDEPAEP